MLKSKQALRICENAGVTTAYLCGEIDHHSAARLRRELDDYLTRYRPSVLRLDLSGVEFMDSSGLGLLMGRYSLASRLGGRVVVCDPSPGAARMMHLAGLERILTVELTKQNADGKGEKK